MALPASKWPALNGNLNINNCARISIRNFTVSSNQQNGMLVYNCNSVTIETSEISGNSLNTTFSYEVAFRLDGSGGAISGFVVRGCYIHNNIGGEGWNSANGIFIGHTGGALPVLQGVQITGNDLAFNGNPDQNQAGRNLTGTFLGRRLGHQQYTIHDSASAGIYPGRRRRTGDDHHCAECLLITTPCGNSVSASPR